MSKLASLSLSIAGTVARTGMSVAGRVVGTVKDHLPVGGRDDDRFEVPGSARVTPAPTPPPPPAPGTPQRSATTPAQESPSAVRDDDSPARARAGTASAVPQSAPSGPPPTVDQPVSREAVEVASVGPADDPGPAIEVQAPWDDYDKLPANEVVSRIRAADPTTAAAVALYERRHKARRTVLEAAAKAG